MRTIISCQALRATLSNTRRHGGRRAELALSFPPLAALDRNNDKLQYGGPLRYHPATGRPGARARTRSARLQYGCWRRSRSGRLQVGLREGVQVRPPLRPGGGGFPERRRRAHRRYHGNRPRRRRLPHNSRYSLQAHPLLARWESPHLFVPTFRHVVPLPLYHQAIWQRK